MQDIRHHAWVNEGCSGPPPSLIQDFPPIIEINKDILEQIVKIGFDEAEVRARLAANEQCQPVAMYHLMLRKWMYKEKGLNHFTNGSSGVFEDELSLTRRRVGSLPARPEFGANLRDEDLKVGSGAAQRFHKRASKRLSFNAHTGAPDSKVKLEALAQAMSDSSGSADSASSNDSPPVAALSKRNTMDPYRAPLHSSTNGITVTRPALTSPPISPIRQAQSVPNKRRSLIMTGIETAFKSFMKTDKLREVKGVFNVDTTTTQSPQQVVEEILRVLEAEKAEAQGNNKIEWKSKGHIFKITNPHMRLKFNLEICRIKNLDLTGVKLKRVKGDLWNYKQYCQHLMAKMKL